MWDYDNAATSNDFKFTSKGGQNAWDRNSYFNFWIVNLDDNLTNGGSLLGFAQFPGGLASTDGVAVDYAQVGGWGDQVVSFLLLDVLSVYFDSDGPCFGSR